jgi:hypothetical protein
MCVRTNKRVSERVGSCLNGTKTKGQRPCNGRTSQEFLPNPASHLLLPSDEPPDLCL